MRCIAHWYLTWNSNATYISLKRLYVHPEEEKVLHVIQHPQTVTRLRCHAILNRFTEHIFLHAKWSLYTGWLLYWSIDTLYCNEFRLLMDVSREVFWQLCVGTLVLPLTSCRIWPKILNSLNQHFSHLLNRNNNSISLQRLF